MSELACAFRAISYRDQRWYVATVVSFEKKDGERAVEVALMSADRQTRIALRYAKDYRAPIVEGQVVLDDIPKSKSPPRWVT